MPIVSAFRHVLRLIGVALVAFTTPALLAQSSSLVIDGYDPNVNGNVYSVAVQRDGKILVAGEFTALQPNGATLPTARKNIARLLPDGQSDPTFNADVDGRINSISLQADGRIVIGGHFTTVAGTPRNRVARLEATGALDASFDPNVGGSLTPAVSVVLVQSDGRVLVGGGFKTAQPNGAAAPTTRNRIARFHSDGSLDTSFDPNANSFVLSLAEQPDGKILVGGGFTTLQPNGAAAPTVRNRIARLLPDGSLDAFDPNANNAVTAIDVQPNGQILIGGLFTTLQPNGATQAINTNVIRLARLNADGTVDANFLGYADNQVHALKTQPNGQILIGGAFNSVGDGTRSYLARLLPSGRLDFSYTPGPNYNVYSIALQADGASVVGGGFVAMAGRGTSPMVRNHVARVLASGVVDVDFHPDVNGRLTQVAMQADGKILVTGSFTSLGGETHFGIARLEANGTIDPSFNAQINGGTVRALAQQADGKVLIGGSFSSVNGATRINFARLNTDGSLDENFDFAADGAINTIVVRPDGKILIGGAFTNLLPHGVNNGVSSLYIALVNQDGSHDASFAPFPNGVVHTIALQSDSKILVGGDFTTMAGTGARFALNRLGLARLNADATLDEGFDPTIDGTVLTVAIQPDGKIVAGGRFTQVAPNGALEATDRTNIVRVNADGSLDTEFDPNPNDVVYSVVAQADGKILMTGRFTSLQPKKTGDAIARNFVARLNGDGGVDTFDLGLDTQPGNEVIAAIPLADGRILFGGAFSTLKSSTVDAVRRNRLALVSADGIADPGFDAGLASAMGAPIHSLTVQSDGRVFVAGEFAGFGGTTTANLARFNLDSTPDTAFRPSVNGPVYTVAQQLTKGEPVTTQRVGLAWLSESGLLRDDIEETQTDVALPIIHTVVVQPDGKLLVGGATFRTPSTGTSLVRLNTDGTLDTEFKPQTSGDIFAITLLPDGKILVGGAFNKVGEVDRNNIARLNVDGSLDDSFAFITNGSGTVFTLALQSDGKIVLGGSFTTVQKAPGVASDVRAYAARISPDGTVDQAFDPGFNTNVEKAAIRPDGKILLAGGFVALRPNGATTPVERAYVAQFNPDGSFDTSFDLKLNGSVNALAVQADGKVLIGGFFSRILDQTRNNIARINTDNTLDAFNPNPNSSVSSIAVQADGKILISGSFSALQPNSTTYDPGLAVPRNRAARLEADGTIDPTFNPNFNGTVSALLTSVNNTIVAQGQFSAIQPTGGLMVGGSFSAVNGIPVNNLALFGRDGSISSAFLPNPNGAVHAIMALTNGYTVIGGAFTTSSGVARNRLARYTQNDQLDTTFNPNFNGEVRAIGVQSSGKLIVGGSFTSVGGVARSNLARLNLDGSVDTSFTSSAAGAVENVVVQADDRVLITQAINANTNSLIRLNADGGVDASFNAANNGDVNAIALQTSGRIIVGGSFTSIGGGAASYLARLNANGSQDATLTAKPNGPVTALTVQPDGKILLGGLFSSVDGINRYGIARLGAALSSLESMSIDSSRTAVTWFRSGGGPEIADALFESSADAITWTSLGSGRRVAGTSNWQVTGATLPTATSFFVRARGVVPSSPGTSSGVTTTQHQINTAAPSASAPPVITSATVVDGLEGALFYYGITGTNQPTTYSASGLPPGLTLDANTGLVSGTPTQPDTYTVLLGAGNTGGASYTSLLLIIRAAAGNLPGDGKLVNVSINAQVTPTDPIIAGFVIKGVYPQTILVRAVGPSSGMSDFLAEPRLRIFDVNSAVVAENAGWGGNPVLLTEFARLGAGPFGAGSKDAAMLLTLRPGIYTMHVSSANGASGYAVAEVYDASTTFEQTWPRLVNLSGRSIINDSGTVVTGGFVIEGPAARRVLIRGVGPGMSGVPNVLGDPKLNLYKSDGIAGTLIATNDNWESAAALDPAYPPATAAELSAAFTAVGAGAFATGSTDAAIIVTLAPGVYTAQIGRNGSATGSAMVEIYELDAP